MKRVRKQVGAEEKNVRKYTGKGVCVAVLDSGVAKHPDLNGRILAFKDFTEKNESTICNDSFGHGTHE